MRIPACSHRPPCPGCPRYGHAGIGIEAASALQELAREHGARLDAVVEGNPLEFRVRARLAVRGRASSPKLGIFEEGSHAIVDIPRCRIHHPRINDAARAIRDAIRRSGTRPYSERTHAGLLRYVEIVVERTSGRVQITLVCNDPSEESALPLASALVDVLGDRLHGLWWNGNDERSNTIFGPRWKRITGDEAVEEKFAGATLFFPPGAFGQSNLDLAERLVCDLHSRVAPGLVVAELHCGVGAIGLGLVGRSRELRFNEASATGLRGLELGVAALAENRRAKVKIATGQAAAAHGILQGADCVIVDPPRMGLDPETRQVLAPDLLLYVSCDPLSLARDVAELVTRSGMRLDRLTPYALFPHTRHVETLAELTRQRR
ncbi:MAG TPA: hypothetical protein VGK20_10835 [Candidatus Binatia bacterium]|jgi:tRNA/tmRNA/rRNA uracil-C5-methylase (TrmA/RlmC/RlmD family)